MLSKAQQRSAWSGSDEDGFFGSGIVPTRQGSVQSSLGMSGGKLLPEMGNKSTRRMK